MSTEQPQTQDTEQLRREIDATREQLGDTVEALAHKADVKARVADKVDERKQQLHEVGQQAKAKLAGAQSSVRDAAGGQSPDAVRHPPKPVALGVAAVALLAIVIVWRR